MELSLRFPKTIVLLLVAVFAVGNIGCGRSNKVYPDRSSTGDGTVGVDGRNLPKNFVDQSANQGQVALTTEKEIELKILAGENAEGAFNGSGKGSLAVLGLSAYDQTRLSEFSTFKIESKKTLGTLSPKAVLLVDLECGTTANVRAFFANAEGTTAADEYEKYDFSTLASIWTVSGTDLKDSQDQTLVSTSTAGTLSALLAAHPNACLRNAANTEFSLPKVPTAGALITLGSDATIDQNHIVIRRIEIGSKTFDTANWGS